MPQCPQCNLDYMDGASFCQGCGASLVNNPYAGGIAQPNYPMMQSPSEGDATGGVIPYKNPKALISYYLGIFSGLPLIGLPIGIAAFVLGIQGLRARRENPAIKGSVHAGIGIGCGGFFAVFWTLAIIGMIISIVGSR